MIRVAIVEDEAEIREQLMGYVQRYTRQYGTAFEVKTFADGLEILEDYRPAYDLILLDIEMKHLDGMETARRIRELDPEVMLVFITNMAQYAIKGYAVGALDYVLKPVPYFAFSQQLQKAVNQLAAAPGTIWRCRWRAACGGWIPRAFITSKAKAIGCISTPRRAILRPPARSRRWKKSWPTGPLPAATAGIWSIWLRCRLCSRTRWRWGLMNCRSAAPSGRAFWQP